jgi:CMP-N-acetylneuraminic acid synthetase
MFAKNILALIPARGGSKGIPGKNIRPLLGKPLIAWVIESALKSEFVQRIIVSTEDDEIASVARNHGADVPFRRPKALAGDDSPTIDTVLHALLWLQENEGERPDYVLLLQATSPLLLTEDIDGCIEIMAEHEDEIDAVVSIKQVEEHPLWMSTRDERGFLKPFDASGNEITRRQDLPPLYILNGALYLCKSQIIKEKRTFTPDRTFGYVMPGERSVDIDNEMDFIFAEFLMRRVQN